MPNLLSAQSPMGGWTLHASTEGGIGAAGNSNAVYAAFPNAVFELDYSSNQTTLLSSLDFLSDISISAIGSSSEGDAVLIGYQNGNIDIIQNGNITNLPAIRLAELQGSKRINSFMEFEDYVLVSAGFGIVKIDILKVEVRESYFPTVDNQAIISCAIVNDTLYASTGEQILKCANSNPAIADPASWEIDARFPISEGITYEDLHEFNNNLVYLQNSNIYAKDSIFILTDSTKEFANRIVFELEINQLEKTNGRFIANSEGGALIYNETFTDWESNLQTVDGGDFVRAKGTHFHNNKYYVCDGLVGMFAFENGFGNKLNLLAPPKSRFYKMSWGESGLIVAGGGLNGKGQTFNDAGMYQLKDSWTLYDKGNGALVGDSVYDFVTVAAHPSKDIFAAGGYSMAPVVIFKDGKRDTIFNRFNSILEPTTLGNKFDFVSDMQYDSDGNLWVVNGYCNSTLKCYTNNGEWLEWDLGPSSKNKFTQDLVVDFNDNIWVSVESQGLFALDYNGTLDNPDDDKIKHLTTSENSGALPSNTVTSLGVDFDNEIWIGTDNGFAILYNSAAIFDALPGDYNAQRIKLEFEGNVEFLLGSTFISDIEIDGGNRKWVATTGSGIFCLSDDGLQILQNFTADNSPLISNNILDLEIDQETGEMYIVTDQGLLSHRIDASYEDPTYETVKVFPNPVRPDYNGPITIQGIRFNSDVTVTDMGGNVVFKTTSNGGTAVWNGQRLDGSKVTSGVYLIWTAANEGKGRQVGKVAVIR